MHLLCSGSTAIFCHFAHVLDIIFLDIDIVVDVSVLCRGRLRPVVLTTALSVLFTATRLTRFISADLTVLLLQSLQMSC